MSVNEFLADFDQDELNSAGYQWHKFTDFDPPFKREELRQMRRLDVIQLSETHKCFRLLPLTNATPNLQLAA